MVRPLCIEYADAWYHIMNRDRRSESIFIDKRDYNGFIGLLKDASEMWNLRITAYCLMPSHYHILAQTPMPTFPAACDISMGFTLKDLIVITSVTARCSAGVINLY